MTTTSAFVESNRGALMVCALLVAMACTTGCSEPIATSELRAELTVVSYEDRVVVSAKFKTCEIVEGSGGVLLCENEVPIDDGDSLCVEVGGDEFALEKSSNVNRYRVELPHYPPRSEYTFVLERDDAEDAPDSAVTLPPPFSLGEAPETLSREEDGIELELELPDDWDDYIVSELWDCGEPYLAFGSADWQFDREQNRLWLEPGTLERPAELEGQPLDCTVSVIVRLPADGQLDPAFLSGWIEAKQYRATAFLSVP